MENRNFTVNDLKNPFNLKIIDTTYERIPDSNIVRIAVAVTSGQRYAALVDPLSKKCYIEYMNMDHTNPKKPAIYSKISSEHEWTIVSIFFKKAMVFEQFFNGDNWIFKMIEKGKPLVHDSIKPFLK